MSDIANRKKERAERKVAVTVLLEGGYQRCVKLDAEDPSLVSLLRVIANRNDDLTNATIFNLELENSEGSLFFAASDLIALSTNPAISIDLQIEKSEVAFSRVIRENYLSKSDLTKLLKFVELRAEAFKPSKVTTRNRKARRSLVLDDIGDFGEMFCERVRSDLPAILEKLNIPAFPVSEIECQITAHNNSHYFRRHRDAGVEGTASRAVTFVYYFYKEPRRFEGGLLRLYGGNLENGIYTCGHAATDFQPINNSMIFFPSACFHEVLPIKCPSGKFGDGRFTVNGWVRMAE
jgi:Rps23 Pro-64 3,4-dihydroxylase Tpa1-like proline 4-hydroxylase